MNRKVPPAIRAAIEELEQRRLLVSVPAGFITEPWGGRIEDLSAIRFAPDGRLFALSQPGGVYVIGADGTQAPEPALQLDVAAEAEQGLSGIAFDPDFELDPWVYLYYTRTLTATTFANEIARFRVVGDDIDESSKQVLLTLDPVVHAIHNGGAMAFGPDGRLYVGVGDGAVSSTAQSATALQGKILRLNKNGSIPDDNPTSFVVRPTGGSGAITVTTTGIYRAIYAMGMRNPFSIDFSDVTGELVVGDVGQEDWEEINVVRGGSNYGWPATRDGGFNTTTFPEMTAPIYSFAHGTGNTLGNAVVGATYYAGATGPNAFPAAFDGKLFFGEFDGDGWINYIDPANPPADNNATFFAGGFAGMVDMEVGPDGALYVTQRWNDSPGVIRIKPNTAAPPAIVQQPQDVLGIVGQPANFRVGVTGQSPLAFQWYRDGIAIEGATDATYTLASADPIDDGASFYVVVSNGLGRVRSTTATLGVSTNAAPVLTIIAPSVTVKASGGVRIDLSGAARDAEDGDLAGSHLSWKVDYYTGGLRRPFVSTFSGATGSFTPHTVTPYLDTDVFYRVTLTATDAQGRSATVTRDVQPLIVTVTLRTNPAGGPLFVNGSPVASPFSFQSVAGVEREIEAPLQFTLRGQTYAFERWNAGAGRFQTITIPTTNATFTAEYADTTPLLVTSIEIDTTQLPWRAKVTFSENILSSVDRYDFSMSGPGQGYIGLPDRPIAFDPASNSATLELTTTVMPPGDYRLNVYPSGLTDNIGIPLVSGTSVNFTYRTTPTPIPGDSTIAGIVFDDRNRSGFRDDTEPSRAGATLFLDADNDGILDPGESTAVADSGGYYEFRDVGPGTYHVRAVRGDLIQTSPVGDAPRPAVIDGPGQYRFVGDIGLSVPAAPTLPTPTALTAAAEIPYLVRLDWLSDSTNVLDFIVERRTADGEWAVVNGVVDRRSRTYNDWSVGRGVTYVYRVRGKGAVGNGDASAEVTVTTL